MFGGVRTVFSEEFSKRFKKASDKDRGAAQPTTEGPPVEATEDEPVPAAPAAAQTVSGAAPGAAPGAQPLQPRGGSVLAANAKIIGNVEFTGDFRVDGELLGDATGGRLEVGEKGRIDGFIAAEEARVNGLVTGGVDARSVAVGKAGRILSDIRYVKISVESGAQLNGLITPREVPSIAEVVGRTPPARPRGQAEPMAKRAGSNRRASRSGINFGPTVKKDRPPAN